MKCDRCGSVKTIVIDSRMPDGKHRWRRRECPCCNKRFSTIEMYDWEYAKEPEPQEIIKARKKAAEKELNRYCNGDNCLECKFEECRYDTEEHERKQRRKKKPAVLRESAWRLMK